MLISSFPHVFAMSAAVALLLTCNASAASQCRGLEQQICAADDGCVWVSSYMRKDGRSVSGHCKLRRGKPSAGEATASAVKPRAAD